MNNGKFQFLRNFLRMSALFFLILSLAGPQIGQELKEMKPR